MALNRDRKGRRLLAGAIVAVLATAARAGAGDGVEFSAACNATYVNKRVGANEQWAITWDLVARASGNVFQRDGGPPSFIECYRRAGGTETEIAFDCYGAPPCPGPPCAAKWSLIPGPTLVPASFFYPPGVNPADPKAACTRQRTVCASGCSDTIVQQAIDRAPPHSFVRIGPGTFREDLRVEDKSVTLFATGDTVIRGSGAGTVLMLHCERNPGALVQWIGGVLTGGGTNAPAGHYDGGGIVNLGCNASVQDANVTGNTTWGSGGGIVNVGEMLVGRSTVTDNGAGNGGGIANYGRLQVVDAALDANAAGIGPVAGRGGGGLVNYPDAVASVVDSTVSGNTVAEGCCGGGGILNLGELDLAGAIVADNAGDGLRNDGGDLAVEDSIVERNADGGLWNRAGALAVVSGSVLRDNTGRSIGGLANDGRLELRDTQVTGNRSSRFGPGGGILNDGELRLDGVLVARNASEDPAGAGLFVRAGSITASDTEVVDNLPRNCAGTPFACP